jgi:kynureninase
MLSGTPPIIALAALSAALEAFTGIDLVDLRARSVALTSRFIALADRDLARHGFEVVTPREPERRGSHVSLRHSHAFEIVQAAIEAGVVGDFREPDLCRFGFAPLLTTMDDVDEAVRRIAALMALEAWREDRHAVRHTVT